MSQPAQIPFQRPVFAFVCSPQGETLARDFASMSGATDPTLYGGGLSGAARVACEAHSGAIVLAEIGKLALATACECVAEITKFGARVIVFGAGNDIGTFRAIVDAGAVDYLPFPVNVRDVMKALSATARGTVAAPLAPVPAVVATQATQIGIVGTNGGVGASALAQNLAYLSAAPKGGVSTLLLDGDLCMGLAASELNRARVPGLIDALGAPDRIDETFLKSTTDKIRDNLHLYSGEVQATDNAAQMEEGLVRMLPRLAPHFVVTILDLNREFLARRPGVLAHLSRLVLVVPGGFGGVHAAARLLDMVQTHAPKLPVTLVLSDLRQDAGLSSRDLATTLKRKVDHVLPRTDQAMLRAQRAGKPLIEARPRAPYTRIVRAIWAEVSTAPKTAPADAPARSGLIAKLFK